MPRTARDVPPPLELLCLNALWILGDGNVREVQEIVVNTRPLAYTTIMTVLDRLVRKGKLSRRKTGRAFVYRPETSQDSMRRAAIRELVDSLFNGSEAELAGFLASTEKLGPQETLATAAAAGAEEEPGIDTVLL
jgi:predicted transcriptional regulator